MTRRPFLVALIPIALSLAALPALAEPITHRFVGEVVAIDDVTSSGFFAGVEAGAPILLEYSFDSEAPNQGIFPGSASYSSQGGFDIRIGDLNFGSSAVQIDIVTTPTFTSYGVQAFPNLPLGLADGLEAPLLFLSANSFGQSVLDDDALVLDAERLNAFPPTASDTLPLRFEFLRAEDIGYTQRVRFLSAELRAVGAVPEPGPWLALAVACGAVLALRHVRSPNRRGGRGAPVAARRAPGDAVYARRG